MSRRRFSIRMLAGSILAGFAYGCIGEIFFRKLERDMPQILFAALYMTGLFLFLGLIVYLIGKFGYYQVYGAVNRRQWAVSLLLMAALSACFEFLYEEISLSGRRQVFSSYLFVIDNSGSMNETDPDGLRYEAIEKLLEQKDTDFCYGVYHFSDTAKMVRAMAPVSEKGPESEAVNEGGTAVLHALDTVLGDLDSGKLILDQRCRMILLSDGYATDVDEAGRYDCIRRLEQFAERGISISTVGMAGDVDTQLLMLVADKTGGTYVSVRDVSQLEQGMRQAAQTKEETRSLLGYRSVGERDWLYGVLRIFLIAVLGMLVAVEKTVLCERFLNTNSVLVSSAIGSVLAGICLELGMNLLGAEPSAARITGCMLLGITVLYEDAAASSVS